MRIYLIGFMGSGKSHVGKRLAEALCYEFVDADQYLEAQSGMSISDIFSTRGESVFRQLEAKALKSLGSKGNCVIATGGGAPCFFDSMDWMNKSGVTVYLRVEVPILVERLLPRSANRPLIAGKSVEELTAFINQKLAEREPFYNQAEIVINQTDSEVDRISLLKEALQAYLL